MTTYLSDTFTRANTSAGTLGTPDVGAYSFLFSTSNTWLVSGNTAKITGGTQIAYAAAAVDVDVQVKLSGLSSGSSGLAFRVVDINNYWLLTGHSVNGIQLTHNVGGSSNSWRIGTPVNLDVLRVVALGRQIYCFQNSVCILETTDGSYGNGATGAGMVILGNSLPTLDNLVVQDPPADPDGFHASASAAWLYRGRDNKALDLAGVV